MTFSVVCVDGFVDKAFYFQWLYEKIDAELNEREYFVISKSDKYEKRNKKIEWE